MTKKKKPGFGNMVAEFASNWKKIEETAKKKQKALDKAMGK